MQRHQSLRIDSATGTPVAVRYLSNSFRYGFPGQRYRPLCRGTKLKTAHCSVIGPGFWGSAVPSCLLTVRMQLFVKVSAIVHFRHRRAYNRHRSTSAKTPCQLRNDVRVKCIYGIRSNRCFPTYFILHSLCRLSIFSPPPRINLKLKEKKK